MKKLVMVLGMASLLASGSALANPAGGNVNFRGKVVASTCEVHEDSVEQTVRLDEVQSNELLNGGNGNVKKHFNIELTNCPAVGDVVTDSSGNAKRTSQVSLHFHVDDDKLMNAKALKNTASGLNAAENVGIQVLNQGGSEPIDFSAAPKAQGVAKKNMADGTPNGDLTFDFEARYVGEGTNIVPGDVTATMPFVVTYE